MVDLAGIVGLVAIQARAPDIGRVRIADPHARRSTVPLIFFLRRRSKPGDAMRRPGFLSPASFLRMRLPLARSPASRFVLALWQGRSQIARVLAGASAPPSQSGLA